MADLSPLAFNSIVAAVGLLLYLFVWRVTRDLPPAAKVFSRLGLAVVAIAPFVLSIFFGAQTPDRTAMGRPAPSDSMPGGGAGSSNTRPSVQGGAPASASPEPQASKPSSVTPQQEQAAAEQHARRREAELEARRQAEAAARMAAERAARDIAGASGASAPREYARPPSAPAAAAPPSPSVATAPGSAPRASDDASAPPGAPRGFTKSAPRIGAAAPSATPAIEPPADYDIVPVFYGTDRGSKQIAARVQYDSERAKRLELGRAMVTVPKSHEMPNIERPWVYRIPLTNIVIYQEAEDPKRHFTMQDVKALTRDEFLALVKARLAAANRFKDHAVVFVHGFNTTFDYAVYRTAQLAYDLRFDGAPFVYSWPSKGQLGLQDYNYDRGSAEQSAPYLTEFLTLVSQSTGAKKVSVIAHSMGNLAVMRVLRDLKDAAPQGVEISQLIMAAPDVDRDLFENLARGVKDVAKGATLYASSNDWALEASKRLDGVPRAGDVPEGGPLVLAGIDTIDVTAISTEIFGLKHSGYAEKTALVQDIERILETGQRPPVSRLPSLETIASPRGPYWRYPKP